MKHCKNEKKLRAAQYVIFVTSVIIIGFIVYYIEQLGIIDLNCPIYTCTRFNCPACGVTRLVTSLLEFDMYQAFRWNPFIFLSIPYYIYILFELGKTFTNTGKFDNNKVAKTLTIYVVLIFTFGILRNTGMFKCLAPTKII